MRFLFERVHNALHRRVHQAVQLCLQQLRNVLPHMLPWWQCWCRGPRASSSQAMSPTATLSATELSRQHRTTGRSHRHGALTPIRAPQGDVGVFPGAWAVEAADVAEGPVVRGAAMMSAAAAAADAAKFEVVQPDTVVAVLVAVLVAVPVAVLLAVPVVDDIESVDVAPVVREVEPLPQRRRLTPRRSALRPPVPELANRHPVLRLKLDRGVALECGVQLLEVELATTIRVHSIEQIRNMPSLHFETERAHPVDKLVAVNRS